MRKPLAYVAALAAAALAAPAIAQDTGNVTINSTVPAYCNTSSWPGIGLGSLVDGAGLLVTSFGSTAVAQSTVKYYCNAPSKVTLAATPLNPTVPVTVQDTSSFANQVNYIATLTWDDVTGAAASTASTATTVSVSAPKNAFMNLQLGSPTTPNGRRPVASEYSGAVTITVALQ